MSEKSATPILMAGAAGTVVLLGVAWMFAASTSSQAKLNAQEYAETRENIPQFGEAAEEETVVAEAEAAVEEEVAAAEVEVAAEEEVVEVEPEVAAAEEVEVAEAEAEPEAAEIAEAEVAVAEEASASEEAVEETEAAEAPAATSGETASVDVMVPTLGESVTEATVSTWFKKVGDTVAQDEMLCELETDKVSVEVPAPAAGTLTEILAEEGATVEASAKLAVIASGDGAAAAPSAAASTPAPAATSTGGKDVEDAPSAKKAMAEAGVSRDQVTGSGRDGRVMKEDVAKAIAAGTSAAAPAAKPAAPRAPSAADDAAREERVKMTRLKQTMARLQRGRHDRSDGDPEPVQSGF